MPLLPPITATFFILGLLLVSLLLIGLKVYNLKLMLLIVCLLLYIYLALKLIKQTLGILFMLLNRYIPQALVRMMSPTLTLLQIVQPILLLPLMLVGLMANNLKLLQHTKSLLLFRALLLLMVLQPLLITGPLVTEMLACTLVFCIKFMMFMTVFNPLLTMSLSTLNSPIPIATLRTSWANGLFCVVFELVLSSMGDLVLSKGLMKTPSELAFALLPVLSRWRSRRAICTLSSILLLSFAPDAEKVMLPTFAISVGTARVPWECDLQICAQMHPHTFSSSASSMACWMRRGH